MTLGRCPLSIFCSAPYTPNRWIWAASVISVAGMTEEKLNEIPANITHPPYAHRAIYANI